MVDRGPRTPADGDVTEDASASWYVPGIPLAKPELIAAIRDQRLRSVSAVFAALVNSQVVSAPVSAQVAEWLSLNHDLSLVASATGLDPVAHSGEIAE